MRIKRKQFTFYYSFYDVISCIESAQEQAEAYNVLCRYALMGEKPDFDALSMGAKMAVKAFMPTLDAARKKAKSGAIGGSKPKANASKQKANDKQTESKKKDKEKDKNKIEIKDKHKCEEAFDLFWEQYPRKVKKQDARAAFEKVDVPVEVLLDALARQKESGQWLEEGGRFVPYPAGWLKDRRWEDEPAPMGVPKGCGPVTDSELGDMERQMAASGG